MQTPSMSAPANDAFFHRFPRFDCADTPTKCYFTGIGLLLGGDRTPLFQTIKNAKKTEL